MARMAASARVLSLALLRPSKEPTRGAGRVLDWTSFSHGSRADGPSMAFGLAGIMGRGGHAGGGGGGGGGHSIATATESAGWRRQRIEWVVVVVVVDHAAPGHLRRFSARELMRYGCVDRPLYG
ncbi:hypothetical protein IWZ03DRAFT_355738 [Phyllosticta citriasiana]|uniref:Uncharacterized protein n=1 Tax=Phyllosticta citriasiana TaxID=595635 RepID=A0ABR1KWS6_9PEZI